MKLEQYIGIHIKRYRQEKLGLSLLKWHRLQKLAKVCSAKLKMLKSRPVLKPNVYVKC